MRDTTQRAKLMLLARKELTVAEMDRMFSTNNSAEIINRLRKSGMNIDMGWETNEKTGKRFGVYFYVPTKKVNRITSRQYART
jgi:chromosome condensin MukBEF MukE localization factor